MPSKPLTILVLPINAVGHVQACLGTTRPLQARGHRVVFFLEQAYKNSAAPFGFEEHIYKLEIENFSQEDATPGEDWAKGFLENSLIGPNSTEEKWASLLHFILESKESRILMRQMNEQMKKAIELVKPDLIITDTVYLIPAIPSSGIPWIQNMSFTPQVYSFEENIPATCSGFPTDSPHDDAWNRMKQFHHTFLFSKSYNDFIETLGYPRYTNDRLMPNEEALLVVYAYPEELNYPEIRAKPWFNLEVFNKNDAQETVDLKELVGERFFEDTLDGKWSGKWAYVSLGSMGSIDLTLMKRLLDALAKTTHKYIVSKGPRHTEYGLPSNAFGDRYLPQTKLVPLMDLVITHGGNNTNTETFALGKPMIVLPLFGDQFDNAQRVHETGFGIRLDPYGFTSEQMVSAINSLLGNAKLKERMALASKRILTSGRHEQLAELIEAKMGVS